MRISKALMGMAATMLLITACANQEEPARAVVAGAETSLAEVRVDAAKFAQEELQAVEASLAKAKAQLAKEDYKDVLSGSNQITQQIATLKELVVSRQTQSAAATQEWESLRQQVPEHIKAIEFRIEAVTASAKLRAEVGKAALDAAKATLATMKTTWAEASAAFDAGNALEAADKGRLVKGQTQEVADQLKLSLI